jgi:BolA protein
LHRGHAGDDGSDETHFAIKISSKELKILTRMEGHRKVNQLLKDEFKNGLHALEVEIV